ncbi:MAG: hypothetical protein ACI30H_09005 [Paludibacteraceae bacterium]
MNPKDFYDIVKKLLDEMAKEKAVKLEKYDAVEPNLDVCGGQDIALIDIFDRLIGSLQNSSWMTPVIQYWDATRHSVILSIARQYLGNVNVPDPNVQNAQKLYADIRQALQQVGIQLPANSIQWIKWCQGILSAARFLNQFKKTIDLRACFAQMYNDVRLRPALPAWLAKEIIGMDFTLACDFLKEIGYDYPKPDRHITDVFEKRCGTRDPYQIYKKVVEYAYAIGISAYKLDKMIWLICSGNFYKDNIKVKGRKADLLKRLSNYTSPITPCP